MAKSLESGIARTFGRPIRNAASDLRGALLALLAADSAGAAESEQRAIDAAKSLERLSARSRADVEHLARTLTNPDGRAIARQGALNTISQQSSAGAATEKEALLEYLKNPLDETTRGVKRNLLVTSALSTFLSLSEAIPTKVSALGIEFDTAGRSWLVGGVLALNLYLFVQFLLYRAGDIARFRATAAIANLIRFNTSKAIEDLLADARALSPGYHEPSEAIQNWCLEALAAFSGDTWPHRLAGMRGHWDFTLPMLVGLGGVLTLIGTLLRVAG